MRAPACSEDIRAEVAELLGVGVNAVHPGSNLIGQGLDSIRLMSLAGRWRRQGIDVDFATLSAAPTIDAWSELVTTGSQDAASDQQAGEPAPATEAPTNGEPFPLAPMQHAMWVGRQAGQQFGGVAGHLYVEFDGGSTDPDRLRSAATRLALRHPMLRVRFLPDGTQRIASVGECGDFGVTVQDLRHLDAGQVARAARRHPRRQVPSAARGRGVRTRVDAAARRAFAAARRSGYASRRRDELPHPDV